MIKCDEFTITCTDGGVGRDLRADEHLATHGHLTDSHCGDERTVIRYEIVVDGRHDRHWKDAGCVSGGHIGSCCDDASVELCELRSACDELDHVLGSGRKLELTLRCCELDGSSGNC